ncbi:MAG: hypothetical protein KHX03_00810 [Clostridium sp.]|nr:hypothetical protein [Clostridium sp.]
MKVSLNTTSNIKNNTQPSFKGFYNNKFLLKSLEFAQKDGSLFNATVSLGLSTFARPIAILSTPKTDKENKKYACSKSISSSLVGYLIMLCASLPVSGAIGKIDRNPKKFLEKSTINNLKSGSKDILKSQSYKFATQLFKLGLGLVIAMPKSVLTCVLIPPIMAAFFNKKQKTAKQKPLGTNVISFKGLYDVATEKLAQSIGKIIDKKPFQKFAKKFYDTNFAQHIMALTDIVLTASFVQQTNKSKKIDESRKKTLNFNAIISTALSIAGGYAINSLTKKQTERFIEKFTEANKHSPKLDKYIEGIKIAKPALIFGGIYYIFIPLISTFLADRADLTTRKYFNK